MSHDLLTLTADIAVAYLSHNEVTPAEAGEAVTAIHAALLATQHAPAIPEETPEPAVSIRSSIKPDYIVCLEDGKKLKMLKRHLMTHYQMTPEQYRARWNLPASYPMVAPNYAEKRRELAMSIGLGRKKGGVLKAVKGGRS